MIEFAIGLIAAAALAFLIYVLETAKAGVDGWS